MKLSSLLVIMFMLGGIMHAQTGYQQTNLVSNTAGNASHVDAQLSNPWGIAAIPGQPIWIANNNSGTSTLYSADGTKAALVVKIPTAANNPCQIGCPTGTVVNTSSDFGGAQFLFDTEDGIIVSWIQGTSGMTSVDNSIASAVYKGLALLNSGSGNVLLAANFHSGLVEVYDRNLQPIVLPGGFIDRSLPAGFAPHSVHVLGTQIFVAYATQDSAKHDPVTGAGNGLVDIFDTSGNFVSRFATGGALNAPWGVAIAPGNFGRFSNAVLVGNFGDGVINAFDRSGNLLGQVADSSGHAIVNPGLWELAFGLAGDPQTLYFTAGGADQTQGLFGTLSVAQATGTGDFSLSLSSTTVATTVGGSGSLTVTAAGVNGFAGPIALSCSGLPSGVSCAFSPPQIDITNGNATSMLTVSVAQGYSVASLLGSGPLTGLLILGLAVAVVTRGRADSRLLKRGGSIALLMIVGVFLLAESGCGMNNANHSTNNSAQHIIVTGTSGSIVHSTQVTLTVN